MFAHWLQDALSRKKGKTEQRETRGQSRRLGDWTEHGATLLMRISIRDYRGRGRCVQLRRAPSSSLVPQARRDSKFRADPSSRRASLFPHACNIETSAPPEISHRPSDTRYTFSTKHKRDVSVDVVAPTYRLTRLVVLSNVYIYLNVKSDARDNVAYD